MGGGEAGTRLEILCSLLLGDACPWGWQQELVLRDLDAGRGSRAAESYWDPGQPQDAVRGPPRHSSSKWDLACVDLGFWRGGILS